MKNQIHREGINTPVEMMKARGKLKSAEKSVGMNDKPTIKQMSTISAQVARIPKLSKS